jgi:two-component system LytT family response regulator
MLPGSPHRDVTESPRSAREQGAVIQCYIADADPFARRLLSDALERDAGAAIAGTASDERDMMRDVPVVRPDVLFVDARMLSTMLRARLTSGSAFPCCVVFMSAVAADAAGAFACEATDFLLKPCARARLVTTLDRVRRHMQERALVAWANTMERTRSHLPHGSRKGAMTAGESAPAEEVLAVSSRWGTDYLPWSAIHAVMVVGDIARIVTSDGVVETSMPLFEIERRLDPSAFVRTHRSAVVNVRSVRRLEAMGTGGGRLVLCSGSSLPVSKRRMAAVRRALTPVVASRMA